ncbi:MAG: DUF4864 domain-containing protein [Euzebyales bacterium]|nr:DUF4864 domain-containing protein [Euzebyales bacterium]
MAAACCVVALASCRAGGVVETGEAPSRTPEDRSGPGPCDDTVREDIDTVIEGQLDAFRDDDYEQALTFASRGFRASIDAEQFEQIITEGFPEVRESTGHTTEQCVTDGEQALLLIVVTGDAGDEALDYELIKEPDGWRIQGASPHGGPGRDSESETTV